MEDPCLTLEQVLEHPQFQRVRQFIDSQVEWHFEGYGPIWCIALDAKRHDMA
jgi:hypothetical protein